MSIEIEEILLSLPGHVYWLDVNNVYLGCNNLQAESAGLKSPKEIIGKTNSDLVWGKKDRKLSEIIDRNNMKVLTKGAPLVFEEKVIDAKNKKVIFFSRKSPLKKENGEIIGLVGISFDITNLKVKENRLISEIENAEFTISQILAKLPAHVYWKNRKGVYLGCNDLQAKSLGLNSGLEVIGKTDLDLPWGREIAENFRKNDFIVMETGKEKIIEEKAIFDKSEKILLSQKSPLKDKDGKICGILGISMDITQQKIIQSELYNQVKKAEKADYQKSLFISTASNEVRGPLANVISLSEIIKDYAKSNKINLDNKIKKYIKYSNEDAKNALISIDYLLKFVNLDYQAQNSTKSKGSIREFIANSVSKFKLNNSKNIHFNIHIKTDVPDFIKFDHFYLNEAIDILIENSIKYSMKDGNIILNVNCSNKKLIVSVKDFGVGIPQESLSKFFKPLMSETKEDIKSFTSPAIKLSYIKRYTELLSGKMEIVSKVNDGTKVTITIPIDPVHEILKDKNIFSTEKLKCLIVEDNILSATILAENVKSIGHHTDVVFCGKDAMDMIQGEEYDIYFIDIALPDTDGISLKNEMERALGKEIVAVAVTSLSSEKDIDLFTIDNGFVTVLGKPVSRDDLRDCIELILKAKNDM